MAIRVLIAPLDWGMGHTTRMIGLAVELQKKEYEIIFALPKKQFFLLNGYKFNKIDIKGYNIKYYSNLPPIISLIIQLPKIICVFIKEYLIADRITKTNAIDVIISDNRPFFRSRNSVSCYVSHQINLPTKGLIGRLINKFYNALINKFDYALIPDLSDNFLAGKLSNPENLNIKSIFCGPLSRFMSANYKMENKTLKYDLIYIASGPQPARDKMTNRVISVLSKCSGNHAILGYTNSKKGTDYKNIDIYGNLPTEEFYNMVMSSKTVVSHAGYTTIMDCAILSKPLVMWPTKGQWEQEYLAKHLIGISGFYVINKPEEIESIFYRKSEQLKAINVDYEINLPETMFYNKKTIST